MVEAKNDPNCVEPACKSKVDMFKSFVGGGSSGKKTSAASTKTAASTGATGATGATAAATESATKPAERAIPQDCPLDREELGRSTWGLLHSMGAYFPENPSKEYQTKAKTFVEALALMYPCVHCADDFQKEVKQSPPRVDSRKSFSMWLCEQHNIVNKKIHKPLFDCSIQNLDERWRTGRAACWGEDADPETIPSTLGKDEE